MIQNICLLDSHTYWCWWRREATMFTLYENFGCGQHEAK